MRKHYMDNLRWITILLVVPYHVFMIYCTIAQFYVHSTVTLGIADIFLGILAPWFMALLFFIAGISTAYSLRKRSYTQYIKERITKLLIPFIAALILIDPIIYFIDLLGKNPHTSFITAFTGFFTSGELYHIWFILTLFIVSLVALPIIYWVKKKNWKVPVDKINIGVIILFFLLLALLAPIIQINTAISIGTAFSLFILGYLFFAEDTLQAQVKKYTWPLSIAFIILTLINLYIIFNTTFYMTYFYCIFNSLLVWIAVLAVMGLGMKFLEFHNNTTQYLAQASFALYIFHLPWLLVIAYLIIPVVPNILLQFIIILIGTFITSIGTYELFRRISVTRFLFGIRK